jgi:YVTN family beta-propeller protein
MRHRTNWSYRGLGIVALGLSLAALGCGSDETQTPPGVAGTFHTTVSTSVAVTLDDRTVWVTNPDADSVSVVDATTQSLLTEVLLADAPPAPDANKRYEPKVTPRSIALYDNGRKVYVAGQTANAVFVLDGASRTLTTTIPVPAEPTAVVVAPDGSAVYVASQMASTIVKIDPLTDTVVATLEISERPFGLALSADGTLLFATHLLLGPGLSTIDTASFSLRNKVTLAEQPVPEPFNKKLPNGPARGVYSVAPNPVTGELWLPHILLAVNTAETDPVATPETNLDFESTVFPNVSTVDKAGSAEGRRLLFRPKDAPDQPGSFTDVVSHPRALAFTPDGKLALVAMSASEDVLVFDAETGLSRQLVRPLPSAMLEGIVTSHSGKMAFVTGRNTHDLTILSIDEAAPFAPVKVLGSVDTVANDPMPEVLRLGQRMFHSANSAWKPITKNFWVACASCHVENGSDAVTWLFTQGPRDTPANFGGTLDTGFLLRTANRTMVQQYDETINIEQGGNYHYSNDTQKADLDALADYVNYAIPVPENPFLAADGTLSETQTRGKALFAQACESCHYGAALTDSAEGNPTLDLSGVIKLHDIGTCVTKGDFKDQKTLDVEGNERKACEFDTPTLRGIFATAPYFHDGSSETLRDVIDRLPFSASMSEQEKEDLVEYVKTL